MQARVHIAHEPTSLLAIANQARESKRHRFRNLFSEVNAELLMHFWRALNKEAASGVDGLTAAEYAVNLERNIIALVERVKAGRYRAKLLGAIYEEDFLDCSHGYRPGRSAKDTVLDLTFALKYGTYGYFVEADIRGFFEHTGHDWLLDMLSQWIDDSAFPLRGDHISFVNILSTLDAALRPIAITNALVCLSKVILYLVTLVTLMMT